MGVFDRHDRVLDPAKYVLPKNYKPWSKIEVSKRAEVDGCGVVDLVGGVGVLCSLSGGLVAQDPQDPRGRGA